MQTDDKPQDNLRFIYFPPSPWSEKARWALDAAGLNYNLIEFTPMLSVPKVRWLTKRFSGRISAPILVVGKKVFSDSLDIARYAHTHCQNNIDLIPSAMNNEVLQWNAMSEQLLAILRLRQMPAMKANTRFLLNSFPGFIPEGMRQHMLPMARNALDQIAQKYPIDDPDPEQTLLRGLQKIRETLEASSSGYLLDEFSYADICVAAIFQVIEPVAQQYVNLDEALRQCWTIPELASRYDDLIEWRNGVYQRQRNPLEREYLKGFVTPG